MNRPPTPAEVVAILFMGAVFGHILARVMQRVSARYGWDETYDGYLYVGDIHIHGSIDDAAAVDDLEHRVRVARRGGS
jgi:hypothetical protein